MRQSKSIVVGLALFATAVVLTWESAALYASALGCKLGDRACLTVAAHKR